MDCKKISSADKPDPDADSYMHVDLLFIKDDKSTCD